MGDSKTQVKQKYQDEMFARTKMRSELQSVSAAEFALRNEISMQRRRMRMLVEVEADLEKKSVF